MWIATATFEPGPNQVKTKRRRRDKQEQRVFKTTDAVYLILDINLRTDLWSRATRSNIAGYHFPTHLQTGFLQLVIHEVGDWDRTNKRWRINVGFWETAHLPIL